MESMQGDGEHKQMESVQGDGEHAGRWRACREMESMQGDGECRYFFFFFFNWEKAERVNKI